MHPGYRDNLLLHGRGLRMSSRVKDRPMRDVLVARDSSIFRLLEYLAGLVTLFERSVVAIMRPPVKWRLDFLEQCWLILKRCTIPLAITTFAAGVGTEGFDGGNLARQLGALDRFGTGYAVAGVRELAPFLTGLVMAGVIGTATCADLGARKVREELDATAVL